MTTDGSSFWTGGSVPLIEPEFLSSIIAAASDIALVVSAEGTVLSVLLNTHIVSAVDTTQCIEAHISKISTSDSDIVPWFNGFGDSKIEAF